MERADMVEWKRHGCLERVRQHPASALDLPSIDIPLADLRPQQAIPQKPLRAIEPGALPMRRQARKRAFTRYHRQTERLPGIRDPLRPRERDLQPVPPIPVINRICLSRWQQMPSITRSKRRAYRRSTGIWGPVKHDVSAPIRASVVSEWKCGVGVTYGIERIFSPCVQIPIAPGKGVSSESGLQATGRDRRKRRSIEGRMIRDRRHLSITMYRDSV